MNTYFYSELDCNLEKTLRRIKAILKKDKNKNIEEIKWIDQEINGYKNSDEFPDYRLVNLRINFEYTLNGGYDNVVETLSLNDMEKICIKEHGEKEDTIKDIKGYFLKIKNHKLSSPISLIGEYVFSKKDLIFQPEGEVIKNALYLHHKKLNPTFQIILFYFVLDLNQLNKTLINVKTKASEIFEDKIENTELKNYIKEAFMNKENKDNKESTYNVHQNITNSLVNNGNNSDVSNNTLNIDNSKNIKKNEEIYEIIKSINNLDINDAQKDFIKDNLNNAIQEDNIENKKSILIKVKDIITLFLKNSTNINTVNLILDKMSYLIAN